MGVYYRDEQMIVFKLPCETGLIVNRELHSFVLKNILSYSAYKHLISKHVLAGADRREINHIYDCIAALLILNSSARGHFPCMSAFDYKMLGLREITNYLEEHMHPCDLKIIKEKRKELIKKGIKPYKYVCLNS